MSLRDEQKRRLAEIEALGACKCGNTPCDGLDCGVYLPGQAPRKKSPPKSREEMAAIRAKAWETRRSRHQHQPGAEPMTSKTHHTTVYRSGCLNGMDYDYIIEVDYTITPGSPETGPTYACGGTPAEPPEVEIVRAVCETFGEVELTEHEIETIMLEHDWDDGPDWDCLREDRMERVALAGGK